MGLWSIGEHPAAASQRAAASPAEYLFSKNDMPGNLNEPPPWCNRRVNLFFYSLYMRIAGLYAYELI
jgi:hypothetical protein